MKTFLLFAGNTLAAKECLLNLFDLDLKVTCDGNEVGIGESIESGKLW